MEPSGTNPTLGCAETKLNKTPAVEEEDGREKDKDLEEKRKQLELLEEEKAKEDAQVALEEYLKKAADDLEGGFISRSPESREKMEREKKEKEEKEEKDGTVRLGADDGIIALRENLKKDEKKRMLTQLKSKRENMRPLVVFTGVKDNPLPYE